LSYDGISVDSIVSVVRNQEEDVGDGYFLPKRFPITKAGLRKIDNDTMLFIYSSLNGVEIEYSPIRFSFNDWEIKSQHWIAGIITRNPIQSDILSFTQDLLWSGNLTPLKYFEASNGTISGYDSPNMPLPPKLWAVKLASSPWSGGSLLKVVHSKPL
jgi:hypothetical protein